MMSSNISRKSRGFLAVACALFAASTLSVAQDDEAEPSPVPQASKVDKSSLKYQLQPPPANFSPPVFQLGQPIFDWGTVTQGELVEHSFEIKNSGGMPLKIERVKPACGCTHVDHDQVIAPGTSGKITLQVDTKKFSGSIKKTASVFTNAGRDAYTLTMSGNIETPLTFEPKIAQINYVRGTEPEPLEVTIQRSTQKNVVFKGVTVEPTKTDLVQATLIEVVPATTYKIKVVPTVPASAGKYHSVEINVDTEMDGKPISVPVRVSIRVRDRIEAVPPSIYFTRRDTEKLEQGSTEPVERTVEIKSLDPNHNFKIVDAQVQGSTFEARVETIEEGQRYQLVTRLPQLPAGDTRRVSEKIIVTTDDELVPQLTLNATASFGRVTTTPLTPPQPGTTVPPTLRRTPQTPTPIQPEPTDGN